MRDFNILFERATQISCLEDIEKAKTTCLLEVATMRRVMHNKTQQMEKREQNLKEKIRNNTSLLVCEVSVLFKK